LKRNNNGPEETHYPGTQVTRISIEAYHAWQAKMQKWSKTDAAKLQEQRRSAMATVAGKKAALSERHVSKRGKAAVKLPKRSQRG
jgi:hypothetical protein